MAFDAAVQTFMVSVRQVPETGDAKLLVRATYPDRDLISDAARVLGMSQQEFMRAVLVNGAAQVLKDNGIP